MIKCIFVKELKKSLPYATLAKELENNPTLESSAKAVKELKHCIVKAGLNTLRKLIGLEIILTNNEIKDFVKAIRSLENRGILLKGTTKKINSLEGELINSLTPLTRVVLALMLNVLKPLVNRVLAQLRLTATVSATVAAIQKKILGSQVHPSNLPKQTTLTVLNLLKTLVS